ncbi:hypothetical protein [Robertkochia solimangrovi]|uniref:hypothetical protein n=1 Tax=Robertkochia solimangrovi TaxID=2213046 RepID=UPI00117FABA7|nr:hypothetical protein [Robertkochia solimangrovi]TRZ42186.1 hypothetical protein DMZ48_14240 [Robertkochia solimangrovi]
MIKENSGKIYRFKLDHNFGFGFAEIYDFTDFSEFDGRIIYTFNRIDNEEKTDYDLKNITESGISLGPIRSVNFPGTRGKYATKYIGQRTDLIIHEIPVTKEYHGLLINENNWNNLKKWYRSDKFEKLHSNFVNYNDLRNLESRILSSTVGIATKLTMKKIIDENNKVSDFYDLREIGNFNLFVQLINTYYPIEKTEKLLNEIKN